MFKISPIILQINKTTHSQACLHLLNAKRSVGLDFITLIYFT